MSDVNSTPPPYSAPDNYSQQPSAAGVNPGKTLGIVALILAIFLNIVGTIVGIVALVQSKKAGFKNGPALAAIIVGAVLFVVILIIIIVTVVFVGGAATELLELCQGVPSGETVIFQGTEVACP